MNCPNCLVELSANENFLYFSCPKCNFLLLNDKNKIRQVDELDVRKKYQQISRFRTWICSSILKHEWSSEGYIATVYKEGCVKSRVCTRCFESRWMVEKHEFLEEYPCDDSCEVHYVCRKCGVKNSEKWASHLISHSFDEWTDNDRKPCTKTRTCKRCGYVEEKAEHQGKWVNLGSTTSRSDGTEKKISERRICQICGAQEYREYLWESPWA